VRRPPAPGGPLAGIGCAAGWLHLPRHGKLGSMSDSAATRSAAAAAAVDITDPACDVAHGHAEVPASTRTLVAVFISPVARFLLCYARDAGYRPVLIEPGAGRLAGRNGTGGHDGPGPEVLDGLAGVAGLITATSLADLADEATDVVVTDHHREELGPVLRDALASPARWVGILGNPRHPAPHIPALAALGVPGGEIARVHRPIGLNIGSRTPAEIALATMAGLIADRNGRPGGFEF
jgi:xanthine/CO dehydrogenase XdhC/CoxF family maturation factor